MPFASFASWNIERANRSEHPLSGCDLCLINQIADLFDVICGTTTGGVIAFAFGLCRMSSHRAEDLIRSLATAHSTADATPFDVVLAQAFASDIKMSAPDDHFPKVFMVCHNAKEAPFLYRSYKGGGSAAGSVSEL